jgi:hypothetical protein
MKCLNCGSEMMNNLVEIKKKHLSYDICESCGSFWLDAGELNKLAFTVEGNIEYCSRDHEATRDSRPQKNCPRCENMVLDKVSFIGCSDIILDNCRNCGGFWLDGGELDLINKELQKTMRIKGKGFSEFINNVHLPYWYKRVQRKSSETDFMVEVPPIKDANFMAETSYTCPSCGAFLYRYGVFGIEIEGCPKCKGFFSDRDELRRLKDKSIRDSWGTLRWMDDEVEAIEKASLMFSKRLCPKCKGVRFISGNFGDSNIMIDWCPSCHGLWLDKGEFQGIVQFLSEKLIKLSSAEMASKAYQEIKEIWNGTESKISEILDAKAAISTLIAITIFEHPALYKAITSFTKAARSIGLR